MTTITPTVTVIDRNRAETVWSGMVAGDVGMPVEVSHFDWRAVATNKAFGAATVSLEESNDAIVWAPIGNLVGVVQTPLSRARYWRPNCTASSGGPVDVILLTSVRMHSEK